MVAPKLRATEIARQCRMVWECRHVTVLRLFVLLEKMKNGNPPPVVPWPPPLVPRTKILASYRFVRASWTVLAVKPGLVLGFSLLASIIFWNL